MADDYGGYGGDYGGSYGGGARGGGGGSRGGASRKDDDARKIFVGGLSWETTAEEMTEYFSKYGEVLDSTLKTDPASGRSRGFGFVLFAEIETVAKVCDQTDGHVLNGRTISPQRVRSKNGGEPTKKVFVGGVDPETPEAEIMDHFSKFGEVEDIHLPFDKMKGQRRGFCFVTFKSEAIVDQVVAQSRQMIGGKEVDVKKATPKERDGGGGGGGGWSRGGGGGWSGGGGYDRGYGDRSYGGYGGGRDGGWGGYGGQGSYSGGSGGGYNSGWGQQNSSYADYGSSNDYYSQGGGYGGY